MQILIFGIIIGFGILCGKIFTVGANMAITIIFSFVSVLFLKGGKNEGLAAVPTLFVCVFTVIFSISQWITVYMVSDSQVIQKFFTEQVFR